MNIDNKTKEYLELLSNTYGNISAVTEEIINLQAIINLPKGTELFLSDIHGEYGSFSHILKNASGIIRSKIEDIFESSMTEKERKTLATLIYYPEEKLEYIKKDVDDIEEWYRITLYRLIKVAREVSTKYTRSKVRKALPKGFDYIIDELLHSQGDYKDKERYYKQIINSIVELDRAEEFIVVLSDLIKRMAIDHLHIIGDIFDRGPSAKHVMDELMKFHSLDIQWGNHDILWMGAACGNEACIANVIRICSRYDNLDTLEDDYGINIRPLSTFAMQKYDNDDCTNFLPRVYDYNKYIDTDKNVIAKIHKAITIIQFKLEGQMIKRHPEYKMSDRLLLDKIDYVNGKVKVKDKVYDLNDTNFPTINRDDPYELSKEEAELIERLKNSFLNSQVLKEHISFLYLNGAMYNKFNSNLLFHGCVPMNEDGTFREVEMLGKKVKGKELFDYSETIARIAFAQRKNKSKSKEVEDLMWYLWCSANSPLFGKDKAATFERYFIDDKEPHKELKDPYFKLVESKEICEKILKEFEIEDEDSHIINGHMPVKEKNGESPIRAEGKLLVIDGGFAKSYRSQTGRAGYTLTYNSHGLVLSANEPFDSKDEAIRNEIDIKYDIMVNENKVERKSVGDTDIGLKLKREIENLKLLIQAYREGIIKEKK